MLTPIKSSDIRLSDLLAADFPSIPEKVALHVNVMKTHAMVRTCALNGMHHEFLFVYSLNTVPRHLLLANPCVLWSNSPTNCITTDWVRAMYIAEAGDLNHPLLHDDDAMFRAIETRINTGDWVAHRPQET